MRGLLACLLLILVGVTQAFAQTTTWNPADKDAGITLSADHLTATGSATNAFKVVRANIGKWLSGKWCYKFTVNAPVSGFTIGLATADYPLNGVAVLGTTNQAESFAIAGMNGSGGVWWADNAIYPIDSGLVPPVNDPPVAGQTGEVCANMNTTPPLLWVTPNASGTDGPGSGPKWNGLGGSGGANPVGDVNGVPFYLNPAQQAKALNSCCAFPVFMSFNGDSVTAEFDSFTPPAGYSTWSTVGGIVPVSPNPWTPLTVNVANAPAWQATHSYALKDRVVAGPAWSGSAYTNSQDLCLWAVTVGGTSGSSADAFDFPCSSGTPANVGGGLDGSIPTGWSGVTTVTEGGVTWALLTKVDYVTLTGAFEDDPVQWAPSTNYGAKQWIVNPNVGNNGSLFRLSVFDSPNSNDPQCTSAAVGTGPTSSNGLDGTAGVGFGQCSGEYHGDIIYSSKTHIYPHWHKYSGTVFGQPGLSGTYGDLSSYYDVIYNIWYGGAQRTHYQAGQNGEADPPYLSERSGSDGENGMGSYRSGLLQVSNCRSGSFCGGFNGTLNWNLYHDFLQAAPGDSFRDNIRSGIDALRYDETKGVSIYSNSAHPGGDDWVQRGTPIATLDQGVVYNGLQIKSENSFAISHNTNWLTVVNSILDGGGAGITGTVDSTTSGEILNSLIIARGKFAIFGKYRAGVTNSTIVCDPTVANTMGMIAHIGGGIGFLYSNNVGGPPFYNNLVLGCSVDNAVSNNNFGPIPFPYGWTSAMSSGGNATDIVDPTVQVILPTFSDYPAQNARTYGSLTWGGYNNSCGATNTNPCTGLTPSDVIVNPTIGPSFDATLKSNSPVKGAGVNFNYPMLPGDFSSGHWWGVYSFLNGGASTSHLTPPSTDILRTPRP